MIGDLRRYAAVNARVRALLPSLLGRRGLEALYTFPSEPLLREAIARTAYESASGSGFVDRLLQVGRSLLRWLSEPERSFVQTFLLRHELEGLKLVLRAVHRGLSWEAIAPHVCDLGEIGTVDLRRLAGSRDATAMAERLAGTPYAAAFRGALHRLEEAGPFAVEVALELDYYERLWTAAGTLAASDVARARHLLGILFDILNLEWIARYRDALGLSPEEILNYTLRQGRWLTPQARRRLAESRGEPWANVLARTPYAPALRGADRAGAETPSIPLWRFLAKEVERSLVGYPFHVGVPLGFLLVQEIEIRDLGVLLAAKGMAVPAAETFERLATVRH